MSKPELSHLIPYDGTVKSIVEPGSLGLASHEEGIKVAIIDRLDASSGLVVKSESWLPIRQGVELQIGQEVLVTPVISLHEGGGANVRYSITPRPTSEPSLP